MHPNGRCTFYIIHRTNFCAFATLDADICINGELTVCYHLLIEIAAYHIGVETGSGTLLQFLNTFTTSLDGIDYMHQFLLGLGYLFLFFLFWISVHKWQTDIRFWHDDRETGLCFQPYLIQILIENSHRLSRTITTGCQSPTVLRFFNSFYRHLLDEIPDNPWWLPSVCRIADAQAFTFR